MNALLLVMFSLFLILPNSLPIRPAKAVLFMGMAAFCLYKMRRIETEILIAWILIAATTMFYLVYPPQPKMTTMLFLEVGFAFMAAPLFWFLICDYVVRNYSFDVVKEFVFWIVVASFFSVLLFFYLFLNYGEDAVALFIATERANVKFKENEIKSTMHIFGCLIFIGPAIVASESMDFIKKSIAIILLVAMTLMSGRTALMLVMGLGGAIYIAFRYFDIAKQRISFSAIFVVLAFCGLFFTDVGMTTFDTVVEKVAEFGGDERQDQYDALMKAIKSNLLIGSGHTAHVSYIRDAQRPWRYELLHLALLLRVGLIGMLFYLYPVFATLWRIFKLARFGQLSQVDIFFGTGFLMTLLATMTNPYMASFEYQWCLILPFCYFRYRKVAFSNR